VANGNARIATTRAGNPSTIPASGGRQFQPRVARNTSVSNYNPATVGANAGDSVGALEAEFLIALALLIMLLFSNTSAGYSDKMMSLIKRGTLVCVLFFILALVSSAGPNAAKGAKAFGLLVIIGILLTSPMTTVFTDFDNIIKNDWIGTSETEGGTAAASADNGTTSGTNATPSGTANPILNIGAEGDNIIDNFFTEFPDAIKDLPSNLVKRLKSLF
jgi:hypothetical protein